MLNPPPGADHATIELLYQPTSWEYVQFLDARERRQRRVPRQARATKLRDAWLATGMAAPYAMASTTWELSVAACADGLDNDGDGLADYPDDPGCTAAIDDSENEATLPCDDRLDGDGDGLVDYPRDPGCRDPIAPREDPQCSDGVDNDGDGRIDWDGAGVGDPDPQCSDGRGRTARRRRAAADSARSCSVAWRCSEVFAVAGHGVTSGSGLRRG